MGENVSRRLFLKGAAALGAVSAAGTLSYATWEKTAYASDTGWKPETHYTICNGCSSKCGLVARTLGGRLWTINGHKDDPMSKGTACGRGHGVAQMAYSDTRLTNPLRRREDGTFEVCTWDEALAEIGARVKKILAESGPDALAVIHDPRPSGKYYGTRFINALGSNNIYSHNCACNTSKEAGLSAVMGAGSWSVDFAKCKFVMFIGRSYGDGIRPSSVKSLAAAADKGTRVVLVDPRLNSSAIFATDWVPVTPGGDLAFLLAMCNVLIEEDLYNHEFVEESVLGFEEFAEGCRQYTPEWAEPLCGVKPERVRSLARDMAKAAPAACVEPSWRAVSGCSYANSFETARAYAALNALLGAYGAKGGALVTSKPKLGDLDPEKFPKVPKPKNKRLSDDVYPLVPAGMGTATGAVATGKLRGVFFYNSNGARGYGNPKLWDAELEKMDLVVAIDIQMSETCEKAHFVLPETSYLERMEIPNLLGGKSHAVNMRFPVIEKIHPETKSVDEIFTLMAKACGVGQYFPFTVEELSEAQLKSIGVSMDELREKGLVKLPAAEFKYGTPKFKTPSGKVELVSEKVGKAGLNPVIGWVPRRVEPSAGEFHVVGGKQGIHSHTMTLPIEAMNAVSREYNLERAWMNAADAEKLGVKTGDTIELSNHNYTGQVAVKVTERICPGVLFIPSHYGGTAKELKRSLNYGIDISHFLDVGALEDKVGSIESQEIAVKVRKVQA
ncbi:molybdopterin-dependent oxidoreductase [Eggerthellaceae bacterium zg-1084]|uniref:Molybdopterin-dependent oxidoreductase n=1 Tax=Berryella wangjianweii TaxID=2734634 RepID=A0A6M8IYW5_9ACTN|nr:molybdopterin-dependent oxidoreductase [Berryella wangjianweii]NPD31374.1 molybdopterin-dependent oxidoreductase [Berryella wangjianweii]NPD32319.1 molybdopterin-dependent oxidoreductase [Eggerthellaceae bacterium zg-997]QKF06910.1 molybdopterin-dependent oxidoreductase [Berryella wangjianweii]